MPAPVVTPHGTPAALGMVNVDPPNQVEADKRAAFQDMAQNGGPVQDLVNLGAGLHAHEAASIASSGLGINVNFAV